MARKNTTLAGALLGASAIFILSSGLISAQNSKMSSGFSPADIRFANDAAMGGQMEVELGRIAIRNGSSDKVKEFGQHMIDDHTNAGNELMSIARKHNLTLPKGLDANEQKMVDQFSALNGTAFDDQYMTDMLRDHQKDIASFQTEIAEGSNADLKDFASATLPTLQEHLRLAQKTENALSAGARNQGLK